MVSGMKNIKYQIGTFTLMNSLLNEIDSAWNRLAGESATNEIHMETLALIDLQMSKELLSVGAAGKGHVMQSARTFKRETSFSCTCSVRLGETLGP